MVQLLLIKVGNRIHNAMKVQEILTRYGCNITNRLGLHEFSPECESKDEGIIILELSGDYKEIEKLKSELDSIESVKTIYQEI